MGIRRVAFVFMLSFLPMAAHADRHFADLMAGPFFVPKGSNFKGLQVAGSWPAFPCRDLSVVGSFGRYWGKEDGDDADHTLATYIVGGRKTFRGKWLPFVQVLGGWVDNIREDVGELRQVQTHGIAIVGGGVQVPLSSTVVVNACGAQPKPAWRFRGQVDVFHRWKKDLDRFRPGGFGLALSFGIVYQFGPEFECEKKGGLPTPNPCPKGCRPCPTHEQDETSVRLVPPERRGPPAPGERFAVGRR